MNNKFVAGIDIGGTAVKLGLFKADYTIIDKWSMPTEKTFTGEILIEKIADSIKTKISEKNMDKSDLLSVGIGVPGSVDENGIVNYAPNVGWKMFDAAGLMSKKLGVSVKVANDANTAAFGELKCGSAKNKSSICFITLGTGVGGGIVVNDSIVTGFCGCGGEIGHIIVNPNETSSCNCGRYGCLEQYASATGIARLAAKLMEKYKNSGKTESLLFKFGSEKDELVKTEVENGCENNTTSNAVYNITAKEVFDCAKENDSLAIEIVEEFADILGKALSNIACLFNPQIFVIGGGVSNAGEILVQYVQKHFVKYAYSDCVNTEFAIASLKNDAGIYGAAALALDLKEKI